LDIKRPSPRTHRKKVVLYILIVTKFPGANATITQEEIRNQREKSAKAKEQQYAQQNQNNNVEEDRAGERKQKNKKNKPQQEEQPADIHLSEWSSADIQAWIEYLEFPKVVAKAFADNHITGENIVYLLQFVQPDNCVVILHSRI
jgi:hypothetical protein